MSYSKGVSWIADTRIPFVDGGWGKRHNKEYPEWKGGKSFTHGEQHLEQNDKGRFTPNLLVCDDMLNDGSITGGKDFNIQNTKEQTIYGGGKGFISKEKRHIKQDKGTNSRYYNLDLWFNKMVDGL